MIPRPGPDAQSSEPRSATPQPEQPQTVQPQTMQPEPEDPKLAGARIENARLEQAEAQLETPWRRLSPKMLLVHPVHSLVSFLPALVAVIIAGRVQGGGHEIYELAAVVLIVVVGVLRYFTTRFRIDNGQIELRTGLINRQQRATPADRVRTVDLTSSIYHRVLGLAKVVIGTGADGAGASRLELDGLPLDEARRLRDELIHVRTIAAGQGSMPDSAATGSTAETPHTAELTGAPELTRTSELAGTTGLTGTAERAPEVLARLNPSWVRYAPLTMSGVVSALMIFGFANQAFSRTIVANSDTLDAATSGLADRPIWLSIAVGVIAVLVVVSVLSVIGYVLQFAGYVLSRHPGGTLHVRRGLVTTRETSIELSRLRGVEVGEHLGLRLGGGRRLWAITSGLGHREQHNGSSLIVPPAPARVVEAVASAVVVDPPALNDPLESHPGPALRRRLNRAVTPWLVLGAVLAWLDHAHGWPTWPVAVGLAGAALSVPLAVDRYRGLGHLLTPMHLVTRQGTFGRRRDVLLRTGVIGFTERQSLFQRRVGVVRLTATTAAGRKSYQVVDCSTGQSLEVMRAVGGPVVEQFVER